MNLDTCSLHEDDCTVVAQRERSLPFNWWPPDFLLDDDDEEDEETESEITAAMKADARAALGSAQDERDIEAIISQRLSESYRIIDNQQMQIHRLREEIDRMFVAERNARKEQLCREKNRRTLCIWAAAITVVTVTLLLHQEISQVGWNAFYAAASFLNISPEEIVGYLTSVALVWLFAKVARAVWNAALEDLMQDKEAENDLFDR